MAGSPDDRVRSAGTLADVQVRGGFVVRASRGRWGRSAAFVGCEVLEGAVVTIAQLRPVVAVDRDDAEGGSLAGSPDDRVRSAGTLADVQGRGGFVVRASRSRNAGVRAVAVASALVLSRAAVISSGTAVAPVRAAISGRTARCFTASSRRDGDEKSNQKRLYFLLGHP